jgi:hypothetical protein
MKNSIGLNSKQASLAKANTPITHGYKARCQFFTIGLKNSFFSQ